MTIWMKKKRISAIKTAAIKAKIEKLTR